MSINASYNAVSQDLSVTGDTDPNVITVSRTAGGTLRVNGGAVAIAGGPATVANTDLIAISGDLGNDTISLDETNGPLPAAELAGGGGNDSLTGGSGNDLLQGESGDDTLLGRAGNDELHGGDDNDTLVGGAGDDSMFGDLGDDHLVWNSGDGSDLWEGGDGSDTGEINGGNGGETFTIGANGARVSFSRIDPSPFTLDIGTTESIVLNAGGGDDTISTSGNLAALVSLTLNGGAGNDTILASNGADSIFGGGDNDFVDGNQGNDVAFLGSGADVFNWDPGDGSDIVEGQTGNDTLNFNGSGSNEIYNLSPNGSRAQLTRDVAAITMDVDGVENVTLNAGAGTDSILIGNMAGTDVNAVTVNLAGTIGGSTGDGAADNVTASGTDGSNVITVTGAGTNVTISGLPATVSINDSEAANDTLVVNGLDGADSINASTLPAGFLMLTLDGGAGADTILASQGADIILGGDGNDFVVGDNGNDVAFLGADDDIFEWSPGDGSDVIEGQAGSDELRFNGSNANEVVNISPNGGRALFLRDVAAITMDIDDVEKITFKAMGGTDNITVANMIGTDVTQVVVDLAAIGGGGDLVADSVTVQGTDVADTITVNTGLVVTGLAATTDIDNAEAIDHLVLSANVGDDVIDASAIVAGKITFEMLGGLGNDIFIGSHGVDLITGGDGNDTALMGAGNDTFLWNPGDDNDVVEGQGGTDTLAFNGNGSSEVYTISPNGGRILLFRDVASVTMDLNDTEVIRIGAGAGTDTIAVSDLAGTDAKSLILDLAGTIGGSTGDGATDVVSLTGTGGNNVITLTGSTGQIEVAGLFASAEINQVEAGDIVAIAAGNGNDIVSAATIGASIATIHLDGGAGNDILRSGGDGLYLGGIGNDTIFAGLTSSSENLDGGDGVDTLDTTSWGGVYVINMVTGATNYFGESFTNFENLVTGIGDDTITGTDGANIIKTGAGVDTINGAGGNDTLDGGSGADSMAGGAGDDRYFVDSSGDAVTENPGDGTDRILTSVSYALAAGVAVEELMTADASGTDGIDLTGNELVNILTGNAGSNRLDGNIGADKLKGGLGNDTYVVDNSGDVVVEGASAGTDLVESSIAYTLATNVENLTLTGGAAIKGTGNSLGNLIIGNDSANTLDGKAGADTMRGGLGDDIYIVDNAGDVVMEAGGAGTDLVKSSVTFTLGGAVENLTLTGGAAINGTGNGLNNVITGNGAANIIDGGAGADTMKGGGGNDTYIVSQAGDLVVEGASAGTDLVNSSVTFTLGGNVENLTLTGAGAINGTGNSLANVLTGNGSDNRLVGEGGTDTLDGGGGNDRLDGGADRDVYTGGTGADVFIFREGETAANKTDADKIDDFSSAQGDTIDLHSIDADSLTGGNDAFTFIGTQGFHNVSGELRYEVISGFTFISGDMDGDGTADMVIRLTGSHALTSADFVL